MTKRKTGKESALGAPYSDFSEFDKKNLSDKQLVARCCGKRCRKPAACERYHHTGPYRGFDSQAAYYEHYSNIDNYRDELPAME